MKKSLENTKQYQEMEAKLRHEIEKVGPSGLTLMERWKLTCKAGYFSLNPDDIARQMMNSHFPA
jgi:hypothetical protein